MLAAAVAVERHESQRQLRELQYSRAKIGLLYSRSSDAQDAELQAYYDLFNVLAGTDLDPQRAKQMRMARRLARYEELTGYKVNSPEFNNAVERTIAAMNA